MLVNDILIRFVNKLNSVVCKRWLELWREKMKPIWDTKLVLNVQEHFSFCLPYYPNLISLNLYYHRWDYIGQYDKIIIQNYSNNVKNVTIRFPCHYTNDILTCFTNLKRLYVTFDCVKVKKSNE